MKTTNIIKRVIDVQFHLLNPKLFKKQAVCEITHLDFLGKNRQPVMNGPNDPRMGTCDKSILCETCHKTSAFCQGHFGYVELPEPIYNPIFIRKLALILNCICLTCISLVLEKNHIISIIVNGTKKSTRLSKLSKDIHKRRTVVCYKCDTVKNTSFTRDATILKMTTKKEVKKIKTSIQNENGREITKTSEITSIVKTVEQIHAYQILSILKKMSDEDIKIIGMDPINSRPEWLVFTIFPIIPQCGRPSVNFGNNLRCEDDLSYKINHIIRHNIALRNRFKTIAKKPHMNTEKDNTTTKVYRDALQVGVTTLLDNTMKSIPTANHRNNGRALQSLRSRVSGKEGRLRGNVLGKRVDYSARTVISPDPCIAMNEIGVPILICKILTFPEIVTPLNIIKLQKRVDNGANKYPGANIVTKKEKENEKSYDICLFRRSSKVILEMGDTVHRHLYNDDYILFNRQPTLHRMSMMGHKIKPLYDQSFRLNPSVTHPYNADFDGDEMNGMLPQNITSMLEIALIANVTKNIISPQSSSPIIGSIMDNILGSYLLSLEKEFINEKQMNNFALKSRYFNGILPKEDKIENGNKYWSGKTLFTMILPGTTLNYKKGEVEIKNGKIISGILSKKDVGSSSKGLIHIIHNDFDKDIAANFITDIQLLTNEYLKYRGFSVGFDDIKRTKEMQIQVKKTINEARKYVANYIHNAYHGNTKISKDGFENHIFNQLNKARDTIASYVMKIINTNNSFYQMINSGAKGNRVNIAQILSSIGQQNIQWKKKNGRVPLLINNRSLAHFNQYDCSPDARGFIESSYVDGLKVVEFFFHIQTGREGIIDTACRTSDVGYIQRKLIKSNEDIKLYYDLTVRNENDTIVQFTYGKTNTDPTYEEKQNLNNIFCSKEEFKNRYIWTKKELNTIFNCKISKMVIKNEMLKLLQLRKNMLDREIYKIDSIFDTLKINRLIIGSKQKFHVNKEYKPLHPRYITKKVTELENKLLLSPNKNFPYNELNTYNLLIKRTLLRTQLSSKEVVKKYNLSKDMFDYVIKTIYTDFYKDLIQPGTAVGTLCSQSIGEPCTQLSVVANTEIRVNINGKNTEPKIGDLINKYMEKYENNVITTHITENGKESHILKIPENWNIKVPGINYNTEKVEYKRVTEFSRHPPNGKLVRIKTKSGKTVIATMGHSFVTKRNGIVSTIRGNKLKIGDIVPVIKN